VAGARAIAADAHEPAVVEQLNHNARVSRHLLASSRTLDA
jgi:hypothetical protein